MGRTAEAPRDSRRAALLLAPCPADLLAGRRVRRALVPVDARQEVVRALPRDGRIVVRAVRRLLGVRVLQAARNLVDDRLRARIEDARLAGPTVLRPRLDRIDVQRQPLLDR